MPDHDAIERHAYELYEQRGRENGHDWDDWLQAERELTTPQVAVDQTIHHPHIRRGRRRDRQEAAVPSSA